MKIIDNLLIAQVQIGVDLVAVDVWVVWIGSVSLLRKYTVL